MIASLLIAILAATLQWSAPARPTTASLRGLAVVSSKVIWASGTGGTVLRSTDGGKHWKIEHVAGAEQMDFRDIKAFDALTAYVVAIGPQGGIYKTSDGGEHWIRQYHSSDPKLFLDNVAFWDRDHGLAMGDPMGGRFLILKTSDGGSHWNRVETLPTSLPGEGGFAASGTSLVVGPGGLAWFATGGAAHARVFRSHDAGQHWTVVDTPLGGGGAGSGIFSLAFRDALHGIAVGGDYTKPSERSLTVALTEDGGATWIIPAGPLPGGYRSGIAFTGRNQKLAVAVGTNGVDLSTDGGKTWQASSTLNLNAVAMGSGGQIWAVGGHGMVVEGLIETAAGAPRS